MCPYHCEELVKRKDLEVHLRENVVVHLDMMRIHFKDHLEVRKQAFDTKVESMERQIKYLRDKLLQPG